MENASFLRDLAVVLVAAGAAAFACHRLGQPKVLGYILAGLILGPHTPPFAFVRNEAAIQVLADLGVIFLMFSLGLEFNLRRLRKVGTTAGITAVLDVAVMLWLGYELGRRLGWSPIESLFLGGMLCDSSTTILAKTLQELGRTRDKFAGVVVGITVVEDVLAVGMVAVLTGVAVTGVIHAGFLAERFWTLVLFIVAVTVGGLLSLPRFLNYISRFENDEVLVLTILGVCFGVTLVAARLELSLALGAVLVGAVASESSASHRLGALLDPLRHTFSAVFFVAVGLMLDPVVLLLHWKPLLMATALVIGGKFIMNTFGSLLTGHDVPTSLRVGAGMAQVGEFAFIIAALGVSLGATGDTVYQVGVGAAIFTTILNPYLIRLADRFAVHVEEDPTCRRYTQYFVLYDLWIERIAGARQNSIVRRTIRRSLVVMAVNVVLISAAMGIAAYLSRHVSTVFPSLTERTRLVPVIMWGIAMLASLPMYVATFRKLQAVGMILAELGLPMTMGAPWARTMRSFLANAILTAGSVGLLLLTLALSWTMFPSRIVLAPLIALAVAVAFWHWPKFSRIHGQAQAAVIAMLQGTGEEAKPTPQAGATPVVELNVEAALIEEGSNVVGRSLRTIRLRQRTGVTLVGIMRANAKITNPGPGERLMAGDKVFLLGEPDQIRQVRALLAAPEQGEAIAGKPHRGESSG